VIRLHENQEGWLLYVLNQGKTAEKITINLDMPGKGNYMLSEILSGRTLLQSVSDNTLEIVTSGIPPSDVEIFKIQPE
jgi:hypothetical protein